MMHVVLGILVTVFAFVASHLTQNALTMGGLLNPGALVLLAIAPLGVAMIAHPFSDWRSNLSVLLRAFRHDKAESLYQTSDEMMAIARAVRETRWADAEAAVARAESEQVRNLAPHLLARLEGNALHEAVGNSAFRWMAEVKSSDDFLQSLARVSPAFGMIGTIMGLVDLFKNIRDSAALGPGMAMALLATLYGLILCYCVYMPLSQRVRTYLTSGAQEQRVIERAINIIVEGRPVHEVRGAVLDAANGRPVARRDVEA
jgi:chemotaxis protein MotA